MSRGEEADKPVSNCELAFSQVAETRVLVPDDARLECITKEMPCHEHMCRKIILSDIFQFDPH